MLNIETLSVAVFFAETKLVRISMCAEASFSSLRSVQRYCTRMEFLEGGKEIVVDEVEHALAGDAFGIGGPAAPAVGFRVRRFVASWVRLMVAGGRRFVGAPSTGDRLAALSCFRPLHSNFLPFCVPKYEV